MTISSLPLLIYGQILENSVGVDAITVKARNNTTNQVLTTTTNSNGLYVFDLSNATSGWADGQKITIYTIYSNFEGSETVTIALPLYGYEQNIALSAVTDSELIDYCTVQNVYDELDDKTTSDISADRVVNAIRQAEGFIDVKTDTSFKSVTVTDEVHTVDRDNIEISTDFLDTVASMSTLRRDSWGGAVNNRVRTNFRPIISVTSLSYNTAGYSLADSWTALTEQTGSAGGYIIEDKTAGIIDFLTTFPRIGKRSWKLTYIYGYDRSSSDRRVVAMLRVIERLTILLSVKYILSAKGTGNSFDSGRSVTIGKISLSSGSVSSSTYINVVQREITELWKHVHELGVEVI